MIRQEAQQALSLAVIGVEHGINCKGSDAREARDIMSGSLP